MTELVSRKFLINGQTIMIDLPQTMDFLVGRIGNDGETFVSDSMQRVVSKIRSYAAGDDPIVIDGELGTGKGFVARVLHCNDPMRKDRPFVRIDCQTIQSDQWESEFFGSVRLNKNGYFQEVQHGTLYIKHIASMPLAFQSKLLQAFKEKRGQKVGSTTFDNYGNFRVIVGSKRKLERIKQEEKLDESLYYHLDGLNINLPSLRNRQDGIIDLAHYFLKKINSKRQLESKALLVFDGFFEESLKRFAFFLKGNITELEKLINDCAKNCIDMPPIITNQHVPDRFPTFGMGMENALVQYFQDHLFKIDYRDKSSGYIAMSIASTFYTNNDRFVNIVSSDKNIHLFSDAIKNNVRNTSSLGEIKSIFEELEARKRELILKYLGDGKTLDEIARELGYSSGAGLTTTIQDMIYESYEKICNERKEINAGILEEIGKLFRKKKNDSYVPKWIVKGLYRKLEEAGDADEEAIKNAIVKQVEPLKIDAATVDRYLNGNG